MRPACCNARPLLLIAITLLLCSPVVAQTLEHRPPAKPDPLPAKSAPENSDNGLPLFRQVLPQGTDLQVQVSRHYPMKAGESIEGRLLFSVFADGRLAIPRDTLLRGTVVSLKPDRATRWHGRLRGDFTPFHTALVQFNQLVLPSGAVSISTSESTSSAPVLYLSTPGSTPQQSRLSRYWASAKRHLHDQVAFITGPGIGDRALQLLYHQLPYHPERIEANASWSIDLAAPLTLPESAPNTTIPTEASSSTAGKPESWSVKAQLTSNLTSATAKAGDPVQALVVEPVFDKGRQLVVPQGSILVGKVTAARAARALGRNGKLRFTFQQVLFPESANSSPDKAIQGSLSGANPQSRQSLSLDAEGTITPRNQASAIAPLLLTVLAGRALDDDGNLTVGAGVASNGFGLIGRIVGVAAGNRNLAAGLGYYAAALSFYENFLHPGRDVVFPANTRIEIQTTPLRAPVLTPNGQKTSLRFTGQGGSQGQDKNVMK